MRLSSINMRQQRVAVLVPPNATLFELATPIGIWGSGRADVDGDSPFDLVVCSPDPEGSTRTTAGLSISGMMPLEAATDADVLVIPTWPIGPGGGLLSGALTPHQVAAGCAAIVDVVRNAAGRFEERGSGVIAGLCLGAFAVAEAGLLSSREAVTHWAYREVFADKHPDVIFENNALYVDHGTVVTSAGSAAAMDCCLHLIREEHGAEVATQVARSMVTPPHREGSQTQFVPPESVSCDSRSSSLAAVLEYALSNLEPVSSVNELASVGGMSRRTLERMFAAELGVTPADWLGDQRVLRARLLLETTSLSIDDIARVSGLGSAPSLRRHFRLRLLTTPTAYRNTFRGRLSHH